MISYDCPTCRHSYRVYSIRDVVYSDGNVLAHCTNCGDAHSLLPVRTLEDAALIRLKLLSDTDKETVDIREALLQGTVDFFLLFKGNLTMFLDKSKLLDDHKLLQPEKTKKRFFELLGPNADTFLEMVRSLTDSDLEKLLNLTCF